MKDYRPEEVTVKTVDNRLLVHAKHEEKGSNRSVFREYNQEFLLPRGTNPELITSTLSTDGVLTVIGSCSIRKHPSSATGRSAFAYSRSATTIRSHPTLNVYATKRPSYIYCRLNESTMALDDFFFT